MQEKIGKLSSLNIKPLCILAAGVGSRLGQVGKFLNKSLLVVEEQAAISHILQNFHIDTEVIVAIGYKSNMVKEYCLAAHPDRNFIFVEVDKFEGKGTGPGYSLLQCKQFLQKPFYFITADCVFKDNIPDIDLNWIGTDLTDEPFIYATVDIDDDNNIISFINKNISGFKNCFIGLAGIFDYEIFWKELESNSVFDGEVVSAFKNLLLYPTMKPVNIKWNDIGRLDRYLEVRGSFSLFKYDQSVYRVKNTCIKIKINSDIIKNKLKRAEILCDFVPKIRYKGDLVFAYDWIEGKTLYEVNDTEIWIRFLNFMYDSIWSKSENINIRELCLNFYKNKTYERFQTFVDKYPVYHPKVINDKICKDIPDLLNLIDWEYLFDGKCTKFFHGDLQFDNIIYSDKKEFKFIDWRDSFGGSTEFGDIYYDLSKLYGGICVSYASIKHEQDIDLIFNITTAKYSIYCESELSKMKKIFEEWVISHGFDLYKIQLITALIYLNMSPLHDDKINKFLFCHAKYMLNEVVK